MNQFFAILKKEIIVLLRDKIGWMMMFVLPIILVLIITVIQDSAFDNLGSKKIDVLVQNKDTLSIGEEFITSLSRNPQFIIKTIDPSSEELVLKDIINKGEADVGFIIPENFSSSILSQAANIGDKMSTSIQGGDSKTISIPTEDIDFKIFFDPSIQSSFKTAISTGIRAVILELEALKMVEHFFSSSDMGSAPPDLLEAVNNDIVKLKEYSTQTATESIPNSTQHNIPAWTVFAIFFIALSFSSNIVYEKNSACYTRLQLMPINFLSSLSGKLITYIFLCIFQTLILFLIGHFVFPMLDLPQLEIPKNIGLLLVVVSVISLAATSYGLLIGSYAKTLQQSNGISAVSVMIFAAVGGIWVPSFVMPDSFNIISEFSPLKWGVSLFSGVFVRGEGIAFLKYDFLKLIGFILICFIFVFFKFRKDNK